MNNTLKSILLIFTVVFVLQSCKTDKKELKITDSISLFKAMKKKNDGKWFQNYTFKQLTIRLDSLGKTKDSILWYESVSYPNNFRIDTDISKNNYVIYKNDSAYVFRQDTLWINRHYPQPHLLFKGGLYFMNHEKVLGKFVDYEYNLEAFKKTTYKNEPVYVVGDDSKQLWIHAEHFYTIRRKYTSRRGELIDVVYDDFIPFKNGWVEQKVTFYVDGIKDQIEYYQDIKYRESTDPKIYNHRENNKWYLKY